MKKVLILSYFFPPRPGIGSQRFYGIAKFLPEFGWEPIVLTARLPGPPPDGIITYESNYYDIKNYLKLFFGFDSKRGIKDQLLEQAQGNQASLTIKGRLVKFAQDFITFPDEQVGWYFPAIKLAADIIKKNGIDAIISTSSPVTAHLVASKLKRMTKIPWIADFRDLWSQNPYSGKNTFINKVERKLEITMLRNANAVVTVHPEVARLRELHRNKNIYWISNGYIPSEFDNNNYPLTDNFTITYTGTLYYGRRDPSLLFKVVSELINENIIRNDNIEIRLYCPKEYWLINKVREYNLNDVVFLGGYISRKEVLQKQRESQLLLLMQWNDPSEKRICSGKLYEYFASSRPILAYGPGGITKDLIIQTNSGYYANNEFELKIFLLKYYKEFIRNSLVKQQTNRNFEKYSYHSITKQYASILNNI